MTQPDRPPRETEEDAKSSRLFWRHGHLAIEFVAYLLVLGYAGRWLDQHYHWNGRGLLVGLLLGMVAWFYRVLRQTWHLFR